MPSEISQSVSIDDGYDFNMMLYILSVNDKFLPCKLEQYRECKEIFWGSGQANRLRTHL